MAGETKYIKSKIQATKKTSQITKAMNMVSASKLKQAQNAIMYYYNFIGKIENVIKNLVASGDVTHPLFVNRVGNRTCFVLITSERGLAGPFNNNIFKTLRANYKYGDKVLPLGTRGFNYAKSSYEMIIDRPVILRDDVRFDDIIDALLELIKRYLNNEFDQVVVIYNHFVNTLTQAPTTRKIIPVDLSQTDATDLTKHFYEFDGGIEAILDKVLPMYIENIVYGLILDSKASEHAARMTAMKSATDNAAEIIASLELAYNRARQQAITLELTDIIGGANATI